MPSAGSAGVQIQAHVQQAVHSSAKPSVPATSKCAALGCHPLPLVGSTTQHDLAVAGSPVTARTVSANLSVMVMMRVLSATNLHTRRATAETARHSRDEGCWSIHVRAYMQACTAYVVICDRCSTFKAGNGQTGRSNEGIQTQLCVNPTAGTGIYAGVPKKLCCCGCCGCSNTLQKSSAPLA
jgi:hypothetical protein